MIEFIFTIDYEIYGNGEGTLRELVLEPTRRLMSLCREMGGTFVAFVEPLEFLKIEEHRTDGDAADVREQVATLREEKFEIGLHLHPWWWNARREEGRWKLDWGQRNICDLDRDSIDEIVSAAIEYLRGCVEDPLFSPLSFRGGLWLMQPSRAMASVLSRHGIQVDSSVFKGGRIQDVGLDYRPARKNPGYWRFLEEVNQPDENGALLEVPIHSEMVPFWKMLSRKRLRLQKKVPTASNGAPLPRRWSDFARLRYPRKLDFCRMSLDEMTSVMDRVVAEDRRNPETYRPIVSIGHTKDLVDFEAVKAFLAYLARQNIPVVGFEQVLEHLNCKKAEHA